MNVLLISANTEQINMPVLPLGMACIAAAVDAAGHAVRVVNLMRPEHVDRELGPSFDAVSPDVIGISVRNIDDQAMAPPKFLLPQVKMVIEECRRRSDAPIVLGGPGYSIFPKAALEFLEADMGIQGEGEAAFLEILDRLADNRPVKGIKGLWTRDGLQAPPDRSLCLDDYPMPKPDVHLVLPDDLDRKEILVPFQTRRGCPMKCSYCSTPSIEGRHMRTRSIDRVIENLQEFVAAGFKRFFFVDNIFNIPPAYSRQLCDRIISAGLGITWQAIVYPTRVDDELVKQMADAGCTGISLGFESSSECILSAMNKKFGPAEIRQASGLFHKHGIERMGFLLLGGPGETRQTVEESIAFAESLDLEMVKLTAGIRIYPDTPLAEIAREKKIIGPETDLLHPTFYLEPGMEGWLHQRVEDLVAGRTGWVS